jgi:lipopolysaccharide export system permease protein
MRILDRYLIRQFCFALFFALVSFWIIFLVVDMIDNLGKFVDKGASFLLVLKFYLYYTPYILVLALPVAMLLSCLFSLGQLARHNELTAMKSAGVSLYRILLPLLILSFVISLSVIGVGGWIVPMTYGRMEEVKTVEIEKGRRDQNVPLNNLFIQDDQGRILYVATYDAKDKTGIGALLQRFEGNRLKEEIWAERMSWEGVGWVFENGVRRVFADSLTGSEIPDKSAKTSADSLMAVNGEEYQAFDRLALHDLKILPEALARRPKKTDEMGYTELAEYVRIRKKAGQLVAKEDTDLQVKIAFPFVNFIIVLFGAPIAANPRRSGLVIGFAVSLFIAFVYYTLIKMGQSLGYSQKLSPVVAAWGANVLFAILGVILLVKAKK